jgi:molecular chaperone DnaK
MPCVVASIQNFFIPYCPTPIAIRNLDEAVAYGCAIKSAILSGCSEEPLKSMLLLEVLHHSLGVAVIPKSDPSAEGAGYLPAEGGSRRESVLKWIVKRNTTVPIFKCETFSTETKNQTTAQIHIYEGDHDDPSSNTFLGSFELHGIPRPPSQDQLAKVEVKFSVDSHGSCDVHATYKDCGDAMQSLTVGIEVGRISQRAKRAMIARAKMLDGECGRIHLSLPS